MLPVLLTFSIAFAAAGAAFLVSYASEHGLPVLLVLALPSRTQVSPAPLSPIWCEANPAVAPPCHPRLREGTDATLIPDVPT